MRGGSRLTQITILAILMGFPLAARAGDLAQREILGFSEDGKRFAFEEHGVFDGSGFPYATIYVIDTASDQWLPGTPVRITLESETASEDAARAKAAKMAAPFLKDIAPRGRILASNPPSEINADPHLMRIRSTSAMPPYEVEQGFEELRLEETPGGENKFVDLDLHAFRLVLRQFAGEGAKPEQEITLHDDKGLPPGRERAFAYRLTDVMLYRGTLVALILVDSHGFETPDGRYIAVSRRCAANGTARIQCTP